MNLMKKSAMFTTLVVTLGFGVSPARGRECTVKEYAKLLATDDPWSIVHRTDASLAICADTAVIGTSDDDECAVDGGAAYAFRRYADSYRCLTGNECARCQGPDAPACVDNVCHGLCWVLETKLRASDCTTGARFGWAVSCSGDIALIGAELGPGGDHDGGAYVFHRYEDSYPCPTGDECAECQGSDAPPCVDSVCQGICWVQEAKLLPPTSPPEHDCRGGFGYVVAISGDTAIIGVPGNDNVYADAGAACVFIRGDNGIWDGGTVDFRAKLIASDGGPSDRFAAFVAISGETVLIGAEYHDHAGEISPLGAGSAYVFAPGPNGQWDDGSVDQVAELRASDGVSGDDFGNAGSISGDVAVIGTPDDDDACPEGQVCNSGSAYVFAPGANGIWDYGYTDQVAKLTASDAAQADQFGMSVSISGDMVVIGALGDDNENGENAGSAYVFVRPETGWTNMTETLKLLASDGEYGDKLGMSVSASGDTAVVWAPFEDDNGVDTGSAYVFKLGACEANIPAVSTWGIVVLLLLVTTAGTILLTRRRVPAR